MPYRGFPRRHGHAALLAKFFFFSSRRRHTRLTCDWSSDVCSSDLESISLADFTRSKDVFVLEVRGDSMQDEHIVDGDYVLVERINTAHNGDIVVALVRSEERRVGKECRSRWSTDHEKKKEIRIKCW